MHIVDYIFIFLLFVVQPIQGAISYRRYVAKVKAGKKSDPARLYLETLALEWAALAVLGTAWYLLGRPIADLGFVQPEGSGFWFGVIVLVVATGFMLYGWRRATAMTQQEKDKQIDSLGDLVFFLPRTARDYRHFVAVSITAGIVEEILYRGFVFWFLAPFMPIWAVIVVSSIAFGLAHSYQGVGGMARVTLIGLAFGVFYVLTGSIWLPMLAHAILDILQGASIIEVLRKNNEPEPVPAT
jgi:membrane protease YdiL (CAAX protease family)